MEKFEISLMHVDELKEMGEGKLEKGLQNVYKKGWKIIDDFIDPHTGEKYYKVEIKKWKKY